MKLLIKETLENIVRELGFIPGEPESSSSDSDAKSESALLQFVIERPADMTHGDYATNVAMVLGPKLKKSPISVAIDVVDAFKGRMQGDAELSAAVESVEVAGPGFINIKLKPQVHKKEILKIMEAGESYGSQETLSGKKIVFEYTDPNPFKVFHIGHLMSNTVGEALSRIAEKNGASVRRYCYQGDVGRHVALTIWGLRFMNQDLPNDDASVSDKVAYFGKAYALGATEYKRLEEEAKKNGQVDSETNMPNSEAFLSADKEVQLINKKIYERSDGEINELYDIGKEWSLEHFEELYEILGTKFDRYFFESQAAPLGIKTVKENISPKGLKVFEESNGAVIFPGEKYGLHTRVFLTRNGLPGYEAKELGLMPLKYEAEAYDKSVILTASEQNEYFKVVSKAAEFLFPEIAPKNVHVSHGMLRLTTGKMSSRTGDVITGESLLKSMIDLSMEKMREREMSDEEKKSVAEAVAVAAIKYTVLRQAPGKDVIFDSEKSLSFEGDSGPYLQYSYVRALSLLDKAQKEGIADCGSEDIEGLAEEGDKGVDGKGAEVSGNDNAKAASSHLDQSERLERLLGRYGEIVEKSWDGMAPHGLANYLMELAGTFNSFYASTQIVKANDAGSPYKVALVKAFSVVMKDGLNVLGIKSPLKM